MKIRSFLSLVGMTVFLSLNANASMDFTYLNPAYADGSGRITVTYPTNYVGGETSESGIWVGQLQMRNPVTGQQFTSFCLSPEGGLSPGTAAYNPISLEAAKYGNEPSTWSTTGGIENASYLWGMENSLVSNMEMKWCNRNSPLLHRLQLIFSFSF